MAPVDFDTFKDIVSEHEANRSKPNLLPTSTRLSASVLELGGRVVDSLGVEGIHTIQDVLDKVATGWQRINNYGRKSAEELSSALSKAGHQVSPQDLLKK